MCGTRLEGEKVVCKISVLKVTEYGSNFCFVHQTALMPELSKK